MNEKKLLEDKNMRKNKSKVSFLMIAGIVCLSMAILKLKKRR